MLEVLYCNGKYIEEEWEMHKGPYVELRSSLAVFYQSLSGYIDSSFQ